MPTGPEIFLTALSSGWPTMSSPLTRRMMGEVEAELVAGLSECPPCLLELHWDVVQ